jgi:hypothetical protein
MLKHIHHEYHSGKNYFLLNICFCSSMFRDLLKPEEYCGHDHMVVGFTTACAITVYHR